MSGRWRGSGGGSGGAGARVSSSSPSSSAPAAMPSAAIPSNVKKTIQHIKEITGNHSEDEIYSVLKECSMDPNETAQKLLLLDTFHEVKRKRDKKKENANNKELGDSRWKSGTQGRGSRGGRLNYAPRYPSHDAGSGRNSIPGRDNGANQPAEKAVAPLSAPQEKEASPTVSSVHAVPNGPTIIVAENASVVPVANIPAGTGVTKHEIYSATDAREVASKVHPIDVDSTATDKPGSEDAAGDQGLGCSSLSMPVTTLPSSTVCFSTSDPVLLPSHESRGPGVVGTIKREDGSYQVVSELGAVAAVEKSASEIGTSFPLGKVSNKSQGIGKGHDSSQPLATSTHGNRPSSNYNSRSQQLVVPQKVGGNKEWKPKPTAPVVPQGSGAASSPESSNTQVEVNVLPKPQPDVLDLEEATYKLQKKLEDVHLPQRQHVIIPNHIHVPESERTKLSFGSFDASFGIMSSYASGQESEKSSTPVSEASQEEENVEEQTGSNQTAVEATEEVAYADSTRSPAQVLENLSGEVDVSSGAMSDYSDSKQEALLLSGGQQYSTVHTSASYNFGIVPPMMAGQNAAFENSDSQGREISRLPNFVVQQPFDPASYYAQYYRSDADSDGRVSPFPAPGVPPKYNGNIAGLPPHTTQLPQEGGNPLVLSTTGLTPQVTQAAGLMQSSIAVTQQPLPVFRPPAGLHLSHYPPNYIPYGHYFSPFYVPPPGIHQFLGNGAFPQQPQVGGLYPAPPAAAAAGVKYSLPQYKPGTNTGNSTQVGVPSGYAPYGASPGSYNPSPAATGGNTTTNEDLGSSQFKENNVYMTGQQSDGPAVWIAAPGRDLSSLPANSFYNIPPQGQHVAFAPTQAGHSAFANMYHPALAVTAAAVHPHLQQSQTMGGAVDMVGPAANVYQQPQHQQINWPSNC